MTEPIGSVWPTTSQVWQTDKITALSQSHSWSQGCPFITLCCSGYQDRCQSQGYKYITLF
jgi:hypothetical protein